MASREPIPDPTTMGIDPSLMFEDCFTTLDPQHTVQDQQRTISSATSTPIHSFQARTRSRSCKKKYQVPSRNDIIEVLWMLDTLEGSPISWCPAEVIHIRKLSGPEIIGTGMLIYPETDNWEEEINQVEFLPGNLLRCTVYQVSNDDGLDEAKTNNNPLLTWRPFCSDESTNIPISTDDDRYDKDWKIARSSPSTCTAPSNELKPSRDQEEVHRLRSGYALLSTELENIKQQLTEHTSKFSVLQSTNHEESICRNVHCVLTKLRYRVALKMQSALRHSIPSQALKPNLVQSAPAVLVEGVLRNVIKVRVDCTLDQFENIARHVNVISAGERIFFYPEFPQTQLPSPCSDEFRILFSTFSGMCKVLEIGSLPDRLEMARKCGSSANGELLRMLGTYAIKAENRSGPISFYMGTSCGTEEGRLQISSTAERNSHFPILRRQSANWNTVDARFLEVLKLVRELLPVLPEEMSELCAFALVWKRSAEVGTRMWSKDLRSPQHVFGTMEARLPCIHTCGRVLCTEFGGLASDNEWIQLLRDTH